MDILEEARRIVREANEKARLDELKKARLRAKVQKAKETVVEIAPRGYRRYSDGPCDWRPRDKHCSQGQPRKRAESGEEPPGAYCLRPF